jgi:hypothetical protein
MDNVGRTSPRSTKHVPDPESKIVFDKFHVAQHLGDALDPVIRKEKQNTQSEWR